MKGLVTKFRPLCVCFLSFFWIVNSFISSFQPLHIKNEKQPIISSWERRGDDIEEFNDLPLILSDDSNYMATTTSTVLDVSPELQPYEIPTLLMVALRQNNNDTHMGLKSMWNFAGGDTQYIFKYNRTEFIESAYETALLHPTSFYGAALYGNEWVMESGWNPVGGGSSSGNESCWIGTQVMKTVSSDGRVRRWQWELRKNRRPPNRNCWLVHAIGSSNRLGNFEAYG